MKLAVFSTHKFEREALEQSLSSRFEVTFFEVPLSVDTIRLTKGFDLISIFVNDDAGTAVLNSIYEYGVKGLLLRCAGFNHVDLDEAKKLGLFVANVPEYSPYAVAEHTLALCLALNRKIVRAHNRVRELNFNLDGLTGFDIHGKTVGVIGVGKIGEAVVRIFNGMGAKILAVDPNPNPQLMEQCNVKYCDLNELFQSSDIITLHAPLTPSTRYIINAEAIDQMKDGVMILNTSRGGLVNTKDVIVGLKSRKLGYLGLDVYEEEKGLFFEDHSEDILQDDQIARLMTFPNVLVTSHQAFLTKTALQNIADTTAQNGLDFQNGSACPNNLVQSLKESLEIRN